jgi:hypothetical protein
MFDKLTLVNSKFANLEIWHFCLSEKLGNYNNNREH